MRIPPRLALSFLILFSLGISEARAQMPCPKETLTQGKCKIESLKVEERTIRQVLNTIAYEYGVPIGLEVAVSDDIARTISFSATNSSLTEVLDLIAQKDPSYTWEYRDGVINFYPKSEFRDTILFNLLETRIKTFNVRKRLSRLELRKSLTEILK
ncbi:MAG: hypothetical protein IPK58_15610 [Acidobacteria bacterium]|nr:hypothetical protein [Acidobacteriota bacterium]